MRCLLASGVASAVCMILYGRNTRSLMESHYISVDTKSPVELASNIELCVVYAAESLLFRYHTLNLVCVYNEPQHGAAIL